MEDVLIYIKKNKDAKVQVIIGQNELTVLQNNLEYLKEQYSCKIKASESLWELDGDQLTITLIKALKGETWKSCFKGGEGNLNLFQEEEIKKKMLKERFQEEHGGFDFSDANITGNVPDPKNFMGGLKYG